MLIEPSQGDGWGHKGALVESGFGKDTSGSFASGHDVPGVRRSPSGRIPQWAIDEALGKLQDPEPWRASPAPTAKKRGGYRRIKPGHTRKWKFRSATVL